MRFSRKTVPEQFKCAYKIADMIVEEVNVYKDLGVILDSQMTFESHINYIVAKANKRLGYVIRNTRDYTDLRSLVVLFSALVRSVLEYASCIWNPCYSYHENRLEKIQLKFIKYLCFKLQIDYHTNLYDFLLQYLGLSRLRDRRKYADIMGYKILNGLLLCEDLYEFGLHIPGRNVRGKIALDVSVHRTNYSVNSTINRIKRFINELDGVNIFQPNYIRFKAELRSALQCTTFSVVSN